MATGSIKVGDTVAITATVRRRVTEDRVSVSIPSYSFPHSVIDRTSKVAKGQHIELTGDLLDAISLRCLELSFSARTTSPLLAISTRFAGGSCTSSRSTPVAMRMTRTALRRRVLAFRSGRHS